MVLEQRVPKYAQKAVSSDSGVKPHKEMSTKTT